MIGNPIPCIPFPLIRGRGRFVLRGATAPLKHPNQIPNITKKQREGRDFREGLLSS
jgi:hypothetical protein